MTATIGARALIDRVVDPGSFIGWGSEFHRHDASTGYREQLRAAEAATGVDEAVLAGEGMIDRRRVAVVAGEFGFLAGSIGRDAAARLIETVTRATRERLPLLASPASAGTRMQEGTRAFVDMAAISAALVRHKAARLPYLVYLRHPTTGGVMASWGSLGHVTVAQPGALLAFLGPRVYEGLYGRPFPPGVQTAENLFTHGLVDGLVPPDGVRDLVARALAVFATPATTVVENPVLADPTPTDAWTSVQRTRDPARPGVRMFLRVAASDVLPLNGTGDGEREDGLLLALVRFGGVSCVLVGQDRRGQFVHGPLGPAALRTARRGIHLASQLGLPLVTVIDTAGAELSVAAEEGGLAGEIARCLADMVSVDVPTLSVLLGEGCGGAALALLPANRTVAAQHAWLSPLPPEGASVIVHRTTAAAPQMARDQRIVAADLLADGIVDRVVPEQPDAAAEPKAFCRRLAAVIQYELSQLLAVPRVDVARDRRLGYRSSLDVRGSPGSSVGQGVA